MILLREVQPKDQGALLRLSKIPGFFNLPSDAREMDELIDRARKSFRNRDTDKPNDRSKYIFVAEDLELGVVRGISMVSAQHGTENKPHFYFQVGREEMFSSTISTGFIHGTLELKIDINGPSEIGGLVVDRDYRNSGERLGRQIAFVRFLFMAMHRHLFKDQVIAELLPPLNEENQSPLWEAIGRRFTNMDYWEADKLCQDNKEFILSLFPSGKIYTTFLTAEARNAIGKVGKDTEPVWHMLQRIGFDYKEQVDPFDGGPHVWAETDKIVPIKEARKGQWDLELEDGEKFEGLIAKAADANQGFQAMAGEFFFHDGKISVVGERREAVRKALDLDPGDEVWISPYYTGL
jgi:arginine N-succinyltransferase